MKEEKLLFIGTEAEKDYFWNVLKHIRDNGKSIKGEWNGDYYVTTYEIDGELIEYWENMEYGIPHSLEKIRR